MLIKKVIKIIYFYGTHIYNAIKNVVPNLKMYIMHYILQLKRYITHCMLL